MVMLSASHRPICIASCYLHCIMLSALRHALDLDFRFEISECRFCLQFCSSSFCCVSALLLVDVRRVPIDCAKN